VHSRTSSLVDASYTVIKVIILTKLIRHASHSPSWTYERILPSSFIRFRLCSGVIHQRTCVGYRHGDRQSVIALIHS